MKTRILGGTRFLSQGCFQGGAAAEAMLPRHSARFCCSLRSELTAFVRRGWKDLSVAGLGAQCSFCSCHYSHLKLLSPLLERRIILRSSRLQDVKILMHS